MKRSASDGLDDAHGVFAGLTSAGEIKARYRLEALKCHPDRGGSHEAMVQLNLARDRAVEALDGEDDLIDMFGCE